MRSTRVDFPAAGSHERDDLTRTHVQIQLMNRRNALELSVLAGLFEPVQEADAFEAQALEIVGELNASGRSTMRGT